ncbi:polysaccharide lyase family 7 protein [Janthinobacterium agaricidamnosum]|uniref:Alginate lyase family protein n=1 Tax=Janthinobacterium agaricidamnosum NBRC 102515 = DSM 9628 TaxID=1349767 RepID=W0UYU0_9BURK|nr:polysaccharide lyase family 7 protein [Janthinobacterium agaricidamnosum]CDG80811.1 alginate lyase family protein [Janthinobacterium agaricidamnosum NBRC 102515 = DSM 9628]
MKKMVLLVSAFFVMNNVQAGPLDPALAPGQNFDLAPFRLQTLDANLQFTEISPIDRYQDAYFFSDQRTGAMTFRVPSGAGHSGNSEFPRVELREERDWTIDAGSTQQRELSVALRVLAEPATGELIFAQIHGERSGGSEALKMRWSHGDIVMGVKKHYGDPEQRIPLLHGVALGSRIECNLAFRGDTLNVEVRSGTEDAKYEFSYAADAWQSTPVYYKVGVYSQDKQQDGTTGSIAVEHLALSE